jgi:hypothetical protein
MTRGDDSVERAADKLQETAQKAATRGGLAAKLAGPLAEDAAFLRKLKPSLIKARARGASPQEDRKAAPSGPMLAPSPDGAKSGPNPLVFVAGALAAGVLLAKLVDWRSHAHPRD